MSIQLPKRARRGSVFAALAGLVALAAIILLAMNVTREIRLLGSARSDNVQWSLVQSQVEFLEFRREVDSEPVNLSALRQEFDIFYSRVSTIREASVFQNLRGTPVAGQHLEDLVTFLDTAVELIDAPDAELLDQMPELSALAQRADPVVRALSTSGLEVFARSSDALRKEVTRTLIQLAVALVGLIAVLMVSVIFLNRLNASIFRREREKSQTRTRMQIVMSTSLDGVIVCDSNGTILNFSPAAEEIFDRVESDVLGMDIGRVIVPEHLRGLHDAGMQRMRDQGEKRVVGKGRVQLEAMRRDGSIFPAELAIQTAVTDSGEDIFIAFLRDITQRVAAQAELVEARDKALAGEKLKTDFLSTMSHEIRTPLNGLLGNMSLLRDTELDEKQSRFVGYMETSGRLLMSHISDVLDITRYDAGKLNTKIEPVNVKHLVQDIVDNQRGTASKNETSISWDWTGEQIDWVFSDYDRLQHVMINLIGNAVKFTRRGKVKVVIQTSGPADELELLIRITDTGPGMSEDLAVRVFDDFVTGNTAYDRDVGGTGLGLSIAKRFVHAMGGEIGVDSVLGEGSTFWVKLPVKQAQAPDLIEDKPKTYEAGRSMNILLVEDNEINRMVAREMLQSEGHTVVEAHDGRQGVEAANATVYDLILMDISMPVLDGRHATREIRDGNGPCRDATIIALTANAMMEEQQKFLADGMNGILTKPLSRNALRNLLGETESSMSEPHSSVIDLKHVTETKDALGEENFIKLLARFVGEVEELKAWLVSDAAQDFLEIGARSHKVAGSAAVFGAIELRDTLKGIETAAKLGDQKTIASRTTELGDIWAQTKAELSA
ncbi:MAG: ATP-binding protein [Yoonia sp.]|uniref:hybrid sensor histidine kinase/response regulator n=1 Tax=Yoonia sp. TaxID=2212373 RepID=UPI003EF2E9C4